MKLALRRWVDSETLTPFGRCPGKLEKVLRLQAESIPVPKYRAKVVRLAHNQVEVTVLPVNEKHVINARMFFNPLLDCARGRKMSDSKRAVKDIENKVRSARRARQVARHVCKTIQADGLLTFSTREAIKDRGVMLIIWKRFLRSYKLRYPDWKYCAVTEQHNSENTSDEKRGSYHIHCAVQGVQNIKWLLRCWLLALGQDVELVNSWYSSGMKLGSLSMGAVNVARPNKRWSSTGKWKSEKLAQYLSKYMGKDFDEHVKGAKRFFHTLGLEKKTVERMYLVASDWKSAFFEAYDFVLFSGYTNMDYCGNSKDDFIWITGSVDRGKDLNMGIPLFDFGGDDDNFCGL